MIKIDFSDQMTDDEPFQPFAPANVWQNKAKLHNKIVREFHEFYEPQYEVIHSPITEYVLLIERPNDFVI